jgi:multidrug efflux pump subunit AcrA (membrane-fusion protein)
MTEGIQPSETSLMLPLVDEKDIATLDRYADQKRQESTQLSEVMSMVPSLVQRGGIYFISAAVGCTAFLLYFSKVPVWVKASGNIVPETTGILVQAMTTGVVTAIKAKAGQQLPKNAILVQIKPTKTNSQPPAQPQLKILQALQQKELEITSEKIRLAQLELQLRSPTQNNNPQSQPIPQGDQQNLANLKQEIVALQTEIAQTKSELENPLSISTTKNIMMPEAGIVDKINVKNLGQSITQDAVVATVIPNQNKLVAQAIVSERDLAAIKLGMKAKVKIDAYNYRNFGTIPAQVSQIIPNLDNQGEFTILLDLQTNKLTYEGQEILLSPGLNIQVEIQTAEKRLLELLLSKN